MTPFSAIYGKKPSRFECCWQPDGHATSRRQRVADKLNFAIHVSHFPPGTSKWNEVGHRLFSFISINWRRRPLWTYETIIHLIGNTTNRCGLVVRARLDRPSYPTDKKVSSKGLRELKIERDDFHGDRVRAGG